MKKREVIIDEKGIQIEVIYDYRKEECDPLPNDLPGTLHFIVKEILSVRLIIGNSSIVIPMRLMTERQMEHISSLLCPEDDENEIPEFRGMFDEFAEIFNPKNNHNGSRIDRPIN